MSKTMAPALRIGWVVAPREMRRRVVGAKGGRRYGLLGTGPRKWWPSTWPTAAYAQHVPRIRAAYGARCDA